MATYVNDLRLTELATGEGSGTWGTTTNQSLELIGEALGYATQQAFGSDADATTTVADGASDPARAMYYKITSAASLTATRTLTIAPNTISRVMFIENATSGSQSIAISQGSGANVTIATGKTAVVYLDGAGSGAAVVDAMAGVDPGVTDTLAEVLTAGNTTGGTDLAVSTGDDITFADNSKAIFGAGSDLQIYHDGSHSYIDDVGTGNLFIRADNLQLRRASGSQIYLAANTGAEVALYHAGNSKLATTASGISVTGTVTADGLTVDTSATGGFKVEDRGAEGAGVKVTAYQGTTNSNVRQLDVDAYQLTVSTGPVTGTTVTDRLLIADNGDISFYENTGTTPKLVWKSADERLGIGTSSPAEPLHVQEGSSGITQKAGTVALIEGSGNTKVTIASGSTSTGELLFGRSTDNDAGRIIYDHNNNSLSSYTNNTLAATIDSSGNVGIGTDSPTYPLTIGDGTDALETVNIIATDAGQSRLFFSDASSNGQGRLTYDHSDNHLEIYTADTESMRIDSSGNVGIGTSSFTSASAGRTVLEVNGASASALINLSVNGTRQGYIFTDTTDMNVYNVDNGSLNFGTNNTLAATIDSSGNVGIGTSSPDTLAHLAAGAGSAVLRLENTDAFLSDGEVVGKIEFETQDAGGAGVNAYIQGVGVSTNGATKLEFGTGGSNSPETRMTINSNGDVVVGTVSGQTIARLNARRNGAAIEFGHGNNGAGYYGTAGSYGNNGQPYIGFSCDAEESVNTFTTRGAKGNIITGDLSGNLTFAQVTVASATGQTPTNRMTLDASGNLLVGQPTADSTSTGHGLLATGRAYHTMSSAHPLQLNRKSNDGDIAVFQKDGTTVGSIGVDGGSLAIGGGDVGIGFYQSADALVPYNGATALRDAAINLGMSSGRYKDLYLSGGVRNVNGDGFNVGTSGGEPILMPADTSGVLNGQGSLGLPSYRWKDLYLSGGVYLGGTGAANKLDDYEEGTWTPTIRGSGTAGTYTYAVNLGSYTKVGRMVSLSFYITNISISSAGSGYIQIIGLPFEKRSTHFPAGACALSNVDMDNSTTWATGEFISASATSILYVRTHGDNIGGADLQTSSIVDGASDIRISICYEIA